MYQGILLEGISGTGKTMVMKELISHPVIQNLPPASRLILTEHHTQRVLEKLEHQGELKPFHHIDLLNQITAFLETLQSRTEIRGWNDQNLQEPDLFYLFERFHLTHVFRFPHMEWSHVTEIDQRLKQLGAVLCVLTVNAGTLEKRLYSRQNECWLNYLKQYGKTPSSVVDFFMRRQESVLELAGQSCLPQIHIDTSVMNPEDISESLVRQFSHKWE